MKIKGKNEAASVGIALPIFFVFTLAAVILRCVQTAKLIDASTGFYTSSSIITVVLYVLIFASCVTFIAISYVSKQASELKIAGVKDIPLAINIYIFAIAMAYDTVKSFLASTTTVSSNETMGVVATNFKTMMSNGSIPQFMQSVFGVLSFIYIICLAESFRTGKNKVGKHRVIALAPVGWVVFRMMYRFVSKISFIRVSDLLLELIMLAFMILFLMALAQVASGVYSSGTAWKLSGYGLSAALVAICTQTPRFIFSIIDSEKYINPNHPFSLIDFVFGLFIVSFIITLVKCAGQGRTEYEAMLDEAAE